MRYPMAATLAVAFLLPSLARAQAPTTPAAPSVDRAAVARAAQEAAEDLVLTRVLANLRLTQPQLSDLLPLLQDAQNRLQAQDRENSESIARHKQALEEVRDQLLAGKPVSPRAETQYAEALNLAETKRRQLRTDLIGSVKRALAKHLGAQQEALILQTARAVAVQERTAGFRAQAGGGDRGGGPVNWMGERMDRIRRMSDQEFAQQGDRMTGRGGPGGGGRGGGGPGGDQAGRANGEQMRAFMAQIRAMPEQAYQQQRSDLAMRLFDQTLGQARNGAQQNPQAEVDQFIDRYFLSPRIPLVVQYQLRAR